MFVCICRGVTDHQIKDAVCNGARSLADVNKCIGEPTKCGKCQPHTQQIINTTLESLDSA